MKTLHFFILIACCSLGLSPLQAQQPAAAHQLDEEAIKQANNPLAPIKAFNVHNYYMPTLLGVDGATANQAWLRYAQPVGKFIFRGSLPIVSRNMPNVSAESGLGDFNLFAIYLLSKEGSTTELGVGPALTFPTGTNNMGAGKFQAGLSALLFAKGSSIVQYGGLLTWQTSFAGDGNRENVNMLSAQPFLLFQLGGGTYLRSTGIANFDLHNGTYNVPVGLGIGKILKVGHTVFNLFIEPQYSVFSHGVGQPALQVFIGFNTQF